MISAQTFRFRRSWPMKCLVSQFSHSRLAPVGIEAVEEEVKTGPRARRSATALQFQRPRVSKLARVGVAERSPIKGARKAARSIRGRQKVLRRGSAGSASCYRRNRGLGLKHRSAVMNQVFQTVRDDIQGRSIDRIFVARLGLEALGSQSIVNFFLDA
jgi:hypothetical protein